MAKITDVPLMRRSAFAVPPSVRNMPSKEIPSHGERIRPSVPRETAELAAHLTGNPLFTDLMERLRREAVEKLTASPLGNEGIPAREVARYELEALSTIESRLVALAAEMRSHGGYDETAA